MICGERQLMTMVCLTRFKPYPPYMQLNLFVRWNRQAYQSLSGTTQAWNETTRAACWIGMQTIHAKGRVLLPLLLLLLLLAGNPASGHSRVMRGYGEPGRALSLSSELCKGWVSAAAFGSKESVALGLNRFDRDIGRHVSESCSWRGASFLSEDIYTISYWL